MYRFINGVDAYSYINGLAHMIAAWSSLLYIGTKMKMPNIFTKYFSTIASRKSKNLGKFILFFITVVELYHVARQVLATPMFNRDFGNLVGTGANYFGSLFAIPIAIYVTCAVILVDPIKNSDVYIMVAPVFLFIVKIACFCNGCCWGIPWEHGLYNHHPNHPGYQVPVQLLEALCALGIFIFFLWYRKKAKPGTLLPLYIILYSVTRFPIEFLSEAHPAIVGPFNTYHFLCIAGVVYGLIIWFIVNQLGENISAFFERQHEKIDAKLAVVKPKKMTKKELAAEEERLVRLEKAKLAREKAKARSKTKTRKK